MADWFDSIQDATGALGSRGFVPAQGGSVSPTLGGTISPEDAARVRQSTGGAPILNTGGTGDRMGALGAGMTSQPAPGGGDPKSAIMAILSKYPATPEGLKQAMPAIQQAFPGAYLEDSDEFILPGLGRVDIGQNFEGGDPSKMNWTWQASWEKPGAVPGAGPAGGSYATLGSIAGGGSLADRNRQFMMDDPGFKFALEQAQQAIERSAAAKGTLMTGGTLKELAGFTTGAALQGYGDYWNRLAGLASMGGNAASGYAGNATDLITGAGNAQAAGQVGAGNAWSNAVTNIGNTGSSLALYHALSSQQPMTQQPIPSTNPTAGYPVQYAPRM